MSTILLTLACSADPVTPTAVGTTDPPASTDTPGPTDTSAPPTVESFGWEEPRDVAVAGMATADVCATCHDSAQNASALRDEIGQSVAPYDLWQSSMMANATRDPLWRAVVSAELDATPAASEVIQQTCLRCHAPLASAAHGLTGLDRPTFADLAPGSDMLQLALDGVSCTLCHQIEPDGLGTEASYDGGWTVAGQGVIYGPHADPFAHPMEMHSGYTPVQADHVGRSDLCATCHVVHVDAVEADGTPMGVHAIEQGTGLEWEVSGYAATDTTCQTCHLPTESAQGVPIVTRIAHNPSGQDFPPTSPRSPVGRHILVGGNTLVPQMLRDAPDLLHPRASAAAFDATLAAARDQLAHRTATLEVANVGWDGGELAFDAVVTSLVGHKLPSGIPLRRTWLRTTVTDASGGVLYAAGAWNDAGALVDAVGSPLASEVAGGPVRPHVDLVTSADDLPVWEAVLADGQGDPTFQLLRGAGFVKDDRLLPAGWDAARAESMGIAPVGTDGDADFGAGGDTVHFRLPLGAAPATVRVELVYQTLSARWANELFTHTTPEVDLFRTLWGGAERGPETVAVAEVLVP